MDWCTINGILLPDCDLRKVQEVLYEQQTQIDSLETDLRLAKRKARDKGFGNGAMALFVALPLLVGLISCDIEIDKTTEGNSSSYISSQDDTDFGYKFD